MRNEGENKMETIKFITSLLTFYMKGEIAVEQNFVRLKDPNSILGLIPLGAKKESIAINHISSTQSNFKVKFGKLIIGIIVAILALNMLGQENGFFAFLILAIIAANTILNAFEVDLQINMTSGQVRLIDFFIFEKSKAIHAEETINSLISDRLNDTNSRQQTDRIVEAINNK